MRLSVCVFVALFLAAASSSAQAPSDDQSQSSPLSPLPSKLPPPVTPPPVASPDTGAANFLDLGLRGTAFSSGSDEARYQRYRDLRSGPTADLFRYGSEDDSRKIKVQADHVGYRDQRYSASYNDFGKLKLSFEWNQIPLFFSNTTATLYTQDSQNALRIDDAIQTGIQNGTTKLSTAVSQAVPFDMRLQRDVLDLKLTYSATPHTDWNLAFRNTTKDGTQPWAGTFGFSNAVELAVPVDTRNTELGTSLEWGNERGMARVGYDGSFFRNDVGTLVWDNPLRITDSPTAGPLQGRMSIWPNSNLNAANVIGALNLPGRSRATAYISVGNWTQDAGLIPFTINSALPAIPLARANADAQAIVTSMYYAFTSKPTPTTWFSARYRSYDFDNRTPVFHVTNTVTYDTTVSAINEDTSPYSLLRRTFDADASLTPANSHTAFRIGYTHEFVQQSFRTYDSTNEDTLRLSADATNLGPVTLRVVYEHANRTGSGLDEQSLDDIGEQTSLRQFDISPRNADRFSGIVQLMATSSLSFNGTVSVGKDDRPETDFGLLSNDNHGYSVGVDYVPSATVSMGLSYQYEKFDAFQKSRQANPGVQFDDPTRDWTTDSNDYAHTFAASMDLLNLAQKKMDVRFGYDFSRAQSTYMYGLAPNTTLPPVVQLPSVLNQLQRGTVDVRYHLTRHWGVGGYYWYEDYRVNNFASNPETLNSLAMPSYLILGYTSRPYTANTVAGRVTYLW